MEIAVFKNITCLISDSKLYKLHTPQGIDLSFVFVFNIQVYCDAKN